MTTAFLCLLLLLFLLLFPSLLLLLTLFKFLPQFLPQVLHFFVRLNLSLVLGLGMDLSPEDWDEMDNCLDLRRKDWELPGPFARLALLRFAPDRAARVAVLSEVKARIFSFLKKKAS